MKAANILTSTHGRKNCLCCDKKTTDLRDKQVNETKMKSEAIMELAVETKDNVAADKKTEALRDIHLNAKIMKLTTTAANMTKLVYSTKESAEILGVSHKSVYRLIQRGRLRSMASLRHKRIPREELERFVQEDLI